MKIHVEMTEEDFDEFKQWRSQKNAYEVRAMKTAKRVGDLVSKVLMAFSRDPVRRGMVTVHQKHAVELLDMIENRTEDGWTWPGV